MMQTIKKGFTLVELLIVIAILAVLAAAVIVVLNPGELLAQARDSQRVSDLASVQQALSVYIAQIDNPSLGACPAGGRCTADPGLSNGPFTTKTCNAISALRNITGTGWIDVNLGSIPGGSPISTLPIDPVNSTVYFYAYACNNTTKTFELAGRLESIKYRTRMTTDGGKNPPVATPTCTTYVENTCYYETGTDFTL